MKVITTSLGGFLPVLCGWLDQPQLRNYAQVKLGENLPPNRDTLPETNMAPESQWLQDEFPFGMVHFQGLC